MSAPCPTARTGTTTPQEGTPILSQDPQAIVPETTRAVLTTMAQATLSIPAHVVASTITTTMAIRPMSQNATCGNSISREELKGHRDMALFSILSVKHNK